MNTYRVFVLNTANIEAPVVHTLYVQAEKYGEKQGAWHLARAACREDKSVKAAILYTDADCKTRYKADPQNDVVAQILDMRKRNVKLDRDALKAILADPDAKAEDKIEAMKALVGA